MRPIPILIVLSLAAGCRDEPHGPLDQQSKASADKVAAAREDVSTARKAVEAEQADVARARAEGKPPHEIVEEHADVIKRSGELGVEQARLARARDEFLRASQAQLDQLAQQITQAEARWGAAGRDQVATLRRDHEEAVRIRAQLVDDPDADVLEARQRFDTQLDTLQEALADLGQGKQPNVSPED